MQIDMEKALQTPFGPSPIAHIRVLPCVKDKDEVRRPKGNELAQFWGVYARHENQCEMLVVDRESVLDAQHYADELAKLCNLPTSTIQKARLDIIKQQLEDLAENGDLHPSAAAKALLGLVPMWSDPSSAESVILDDIEQTANELLQLRRACLDVIAGRSEVL